MVRPLIMSPTLFILAVDYLKFLSLLPVKKSAKGTELEPGPHHFIWNPCGFSFEKAPALFEEYWQNDREQVFSRLPLESLEMVAALLKLNGVPADPLWNFYPVLELCRYGSSATALHRFLEALVSGTLAEDALV